MVAEHIARTDDHRLLLTNTNESDEEATSAVLHPAASMIVSIRVISAWPRGRSRTRWLRILAPSEASRTPAAVPRLRYPHGGQPARRTWRGRSCGLLFSFGL